MTKDVLYVDSVFKAFGQREILTDIYLQCGTGDIIGLLGRNGCGKSTLLKIIFGTIDAGHKFVKINDTIFQKTFKTTGQVGYLPQHNFLPKLSTAKNIVKLFLGLQNIDQFFDDVILKKLRDSKIHSLSGGELRYLEIKLILHSQNKFVLLDEPFNGVAPLIIDILKPMIIAQSKTKGILLTDHDHNNVWDIATKKYLISDGSIKQVSKKEHLIEFGYLPESMFPQC